MKRIGTDVNSSDYWSAKADAYISSLHGSYHRDRLGMITRLAEGVNLDGASCLDFGCGEGVYAKILNSQGAKVIGIDIDQTMIDLATEQFIKNPDCTFFIGNVDSLKDLPDSSQDLIVSLNVLAYMTKEEEHTFYQESNRILKDGGHMIITHSNELFDMFTFNKYTLNFYATHFSDLVKADISPLLKHSNKPDRTTFHIRENPLSYKFKLEKYGFEEVSQDFSHIHELPPLLTPEINPDEINAKEYVSANDLAREDRWKLMFMASIYGSCSKKVGKCSI